MGARLPPRAGARASRCGGAAGTWWPRGDTLWHIAEVHYGYGRGLPAPPRANWEAVPDANVIYPCQRLFIPRWRCCDLRDEPEAAAPPRLPAPSAAARARRPGGCSRGGAGSNAGRGGGGRGPRRQSSEAGRPACKAGAQNWRALGVPPSTSPQSRSKPEHATAPPSPRPRRARRRGPGLRALAVRRHLAVLRGLRPYVWPSDRPDLKATVALSLGLMLLAKLVTVAMPFTFKWATDALVAASGGSVPGRRRRPG